VLRCVNDVRLLLRLNTLTVQYNEFISGSEALVNKNMTDRQTNEMKVH